MHGLENSDFIANYVKYNSGLSIMHGDIECSELPSESYNVITFLDIMPHLFDPQEALSKAKNSLKKEGILIIKCFQRSPYFIKIIKKIMFFRKDKGASMLLLPHAFYHFTSESFSKLLQRKGFKIRAVLNINHNRVDYGYLLKHPRTLYYVFLNKFFIKLSQPSTHFLIFAEKR